MWKLCTNGLRVCIFCTIKNGHERIFVHSCLKQNLHVASRITDRCSLLQSEKNCFLKALIEEPVLLFENVLHHIERYCSAAFMTGIHCFLSRAVKTKWRQVKTAADAKRLTRSTNIYFGFKEAELMSLSKTWKTFFFYLCLASIYR